MSSPSTERSVLQESHFIRLREETLHVRRLHAKGATELGPPVLLLHGAAGNARIFYNSAGARLGPYLARRGFDVYACDMRGRGRSTPRISRASRHGHTEVITEDIAAFRELIRSRRGDTPQFWCGHSWGAVLLLSHLSRFEESRQLVRGMVFFGAKRIIRARTWERTLKLDFFWHHVARALLKVHGYVPARAFGVGSDNETARSHQDIARWMEPGQWVDPADGYDYGKSVVSTRLPPMLFLTGSKDLSLGHPRDAQALIQELGQQQVELRVLGTAQGNLHDYGHVDLLTHPDAARDHFPEVARFLDDQADAVRFPGPRPAEQAPVRLGTAGFRGFKPLPVPLD